jgi:hypothetical protein
MWIFEIPGVLKMEKELKKGLGGIKAAILDEF